jgi:hypothetical protein
MVRPEVSARPVAAPAAAGDPFQLEELQPLVERVALEQQDAARPRHST